MNAPLLLTEDEAAAQLKVCARSLRKARQAGKLAFVRIGKRILYTPGDLQQFVERQTMIEQPSQRATPRRSARRSSGKVIPFSQRAAK